ncbi:putative cobyrinic acid a c-diamide synthase [Fasciola hepatica]|uniref:Queuosine 5'-phosphate N-glycosylase/hydrolase n=1 Tax=Fasciola hepatica TaxID=6192 RepID=A0A4E0RTT9_FASHE|nr:putative cobyrinic acid a c-diamide synthase [Fasciola hepatica]
MMCVCVMISFAARMEIIGATLSNFCPRGHRIAGSSDCRIHLVSASPPMPVLGPRMSAQFVSSAAQHVSIDELGIEKLANEVVSNFASASYSVYSWIAEKLTPNSADDRAVEWIFVTDLLNFSFWSEPSYSVEYRGEIHTGYWALCAAVNRAIEDGVDLLDPRVYKDISESSLRHVFRSADDSVPIPLFEERLRLLHEAGTTLMNNFDGKFLNVVRLAEHSGMKLLDLLCEHFASFRDTAVFHGQEVSFLKRAQIIVGDLWSCFAGHGVGAFTDIDEITAFADYRIPQVLVYFGVLQYDAKLSGLLKKGELIPNGSEWEVEIRGCTLHAIELVVKRARIKLESWTRDTGKAPVLCNAVLVDNFLWTFRRKHAEIIDQTMPMHRTRCIFY